jgi:hypothetical protein
MFESTGRSFVACIQLRVVTTPIPTDSRIKAQGEYLSAEFIPAIRDFKERNPDTLIFLDMANDDFILSLCLTLRHSALPSTSSPAGSMSEAALSGTLSHDGRKMESYWLPSVDISMSLQKSTVQYAR